MDEGDSDARAVIEDAEGDDRPAETVTREEIEAIEFEPAEGDDLTAESADEFVRNVAAVAPVEPTRAGDQIGELVRVAREFEGDLREAAGETIHLIGARRPRELELWVDRFVDLAEHENDDLAAIGLRSLAQLAAENPRAAGGGLDLAVIELTSGTLELRLAALAVVAEVGSHDPGAVHHVDGRVAEAMGADHPSVRLAAVIAAGRLLGADPTHFPRSATALHDALEDGDERVREYAHAAMGHVAREHPDHVDADRVVPAFLGASDDELNLERGEVRSVLRALLGDEYGD